MAVHTCTGKDKDDCTVIKVYEVHLLRVVSTTKAIASAVVAIVTFKLVGSRLMGSIYRGLYQPKMPSVQLWL